MTTNFLKAAWDKLWRTFFIGLGLYLVVFIGCWATNYLTSFAAPNVQSAATAVLAKYGERSDGLVFFEESVTNAPPLGISIQREGSIKGPLVHTVGFRRATNEVLYRFELTEFTKHRWIAGAYESFRLGGTE